MVVLGGWGLNKTKLILISTQVEDVVEVWSEKVLKINFDGWVAGSSGNKAISAFNYYVEVEVEAELGNESESKVSI